MAKIAVDFEKHLNATHPPEARIIGSGDGWALSDVICTAGPHDSPFEEQHGRTSIAVVLSGTFQYHTASGRELMTPGSLLLGDAGDHFCCGHEHGVGDRCIAVSYSTEFFDRLAWDAVGARTSGTRWRFGVPRLPPIRVLAPIVARASTLLPDADGGACEQLIFELAAHAAQTAHGAAPDRIGAKPSSLARVTRVVRMIENEPAMPHELTSLAQIARLSPYHFLRAFQEVTGTTPHQYLLRGRLRQAAIRLKTESTRIIEIALACGFGDVSNFNRAFRGEFGMNPRAYRFKG
ncbi:MAG: helix-turn-helix transcriptional regulator [Acidobacteria bacterium]|nr:helix-turn-helix transcriptional regulator [Acidobacteriota bacterium]